MHHLKKWIVMLTAILLLVNVPLQTAHASEKTVYDQYKKNSQQEKNLPPAKPDTSAASTGLYALQFIGSFLLIIALIYLVLRFISRKTKLLGSGGAFHAIGGHPFGNNRSVQLLMIGDTLYILGVGESINVIRMIPPGAEQTKLLESVAETPVDISDKWKGKWKLKWKWNRDFFNRKTKEEKWNAQFIEQLKDVQSNQAHNQDRS
ncbi:flagellar biosynthetic protein FliO [Neobacillus sp. NPDC093127]|uniref:flagellar biosynthetic protein FliO n=1 Tax=Neobacillus sp. NPDC093127 TaxID=3364296 RepID=UPI00380203C4